MGRRSTLSGSVAAFIIDNAVTDKGVLAGFLDGGDRTTVLNQSPPSTPSPFEFRTSRSSPSSAQCSLRSTPVPEQSPINVLTAQPASLLVTNLPAVLFSQLTDLYPLFCPFGTVKNLQILDSSVAALDRGDISVQVEYTTFAQAHDACAALQGQMYSTKPVEVEFLRKPSSDVPLQAGNDLKAGLNPHAAPFVAPTGLPADSFFAPAAPFYSKSDQNHAAVHAKGAGRIATDIRIGTRVDREIPVGEGNDHKVKRVQEILARDAQAAADQ